MNRLIIIGNGFDLAHKLKTSYTDFIKWYWAQRVDTFQGNTTQESCDDFCKISITESCWEVFAYGCSYFRGMEVEKKYELIQQMKASNSFSFKITQLLSEIDKSIETKGWVDIENDYYRLLKECLEKQECHNKAKILNMQLDALKEKLVEYLETQELFNKENIMSSIGLYLKEKMTEPLLFDDISIKGQGLLKEKDEELFASIKTSNYKPEQTMLLNFNYTDTVEQLYGNIGECNHIHGELSNPKNIIFGYGDELDKDFKEMEDMSDNELLKYAKSVRYLETGNYRDFLRFIEADLFQVFIMGHSCGNSDRTLLHTVFEHKNCVSIKPFYHKKEDGSDNYLELVQNISRNFNDKELLRDRVVSKERCETM